MCVRHLLLSWAAQQIITSTLYHQSSRFFSKTLKYPKLDGEKKRRMNEKIQKNVKLTVKLCTKLFKSVNINWSDALGALNVYNICTRASSNVQKSAANKGKTVNQFNSLLPSICSWSTSQFNRLTFFWICSSIHRSCLLSLFQWIYIYIYKYHSVCNANIHDIFTPFRQNDIQHLFHQ